jgi:hypothetical protein
MTMIVNVWYKDREEGLQQVAAVYVPAHQLGFKKHPVENALEYAFARTQNIFGSWSMPEYFPNGERNEDYSENVTAAPLVDGRGHRSSMVGDIFTIKDDAMYVYVCDSFGFKCVSRTELSA